MPQFKAAVVGTGFIGPVHVEGHRDKPNELLIRDPTLVGDSARTFIQYPGGHNEGFADTFKQCFRAFYGAIDARDLSGAGTFPTFADGHREIVLCDAILKSHRERRWVNVDEESDV